MIPGTDILTDVAAEDPTLEMSRRRPSDRSPMFYGKVRQTQCRINDIRSDDRARRTGFKTESAGSAVVGCRRIVVELARGKDLAEKDP
jgi:hypothetical protein